MLALPTDTNAEIQGHTTHGTIVSDHVYHAQSHMQHSSTVLHGINLKKRLMAPLAPVKRLLRFIAPKAM